MPIGATFVSIHAPLARCDIRLFNNPYALNVSIHAPLARCDLVYWWRYSPFYVSIHAPLARCDVCCLLCSLVPSVSIHAPLARCDSLSDFANYLHIGFNPRTPCEVRRALLYLVMQGRMFQSTHPLRGATYDGVQNTRDEIVSIHAPLARCDFRRDVYVKHLRSFNPRTPCEVRPTLSTGWITSQLFQSTHPLRGATRKSSSLFTYI